jgi:hypothetical protein
VGVRACVRTVTWWWWRRRRRRRRRITKDEKQ